MITRRRAGEEEANKPTRLFWLLRQSRSGSFGINRGQRNQRHHLQSAQGGAGGRLAAVGGGATPLLRHMLLPPNQHPVLLLHVCGTGDMPSHSLEGRFANLPCATATVSAPCAASPCLQGGAPPDNLSAGSSFTMAHLLHHCSASTSCIANRRWSDAGSHNEMHFGHKPRATLLGFSQTLTGSGSTTAKQVRQGHTVKEQAGAEGCGVLPSSAVFVE